MSNSPTKTERLPKEEYNNVPVYYCKDCLSLRVMSVPGIDDAEFCDECNSTNIGQCSIEEWRELFKKRHGFDYLTEQY